MEVPNKTISHTKRVTDRWSYYRNNNFLLLKQTKEMLSLRELLADSNLFNISILIEQLFQNFCNIVLSPPPSLLTKSLMMDSHQTCICYDDQLLT